MMAVTEGKALPGTKGRFIVCTIGQSNLGQRDQGKNREYRMHAEFYLGLETSVLFR